MASCAPACCICWAMAQAMLRLLATPNTTTVRPSKQFDIRCHSSAHNTAKWLRISATARDVSHWGEGTAASEICHHERSEGSAFAHPLKSRFLAPKPDRKSV